MESIFSSEKSTWSNALAVAPRNPVRQIRTEANNNVKAHDAKIAKIRKDTLARAICVSPEYSGFDFIKAELGTCRGDNATLLFPDERGVGIIPSNFLSSKLQVIVGSLIL